MNESIAKLIIENCRNDYLFENFSIAICSKEHGIEFLPTSQSWDRGRDARSAGFSSGSHRNILCATLNRDIDAKVEADLLRVTSTSSPDHLVYSSSQYLSEEKCDDITASIKRHSPSGSSIVYGSLQLAKLATKFPTIFEKFFRAELDSIRQTLNPSEADDDERKKSLRLALLTSGQSEGANLREDILRRVALESLLGGVSLTSTAITEAFSTDLGLPRPIQAAAIEAVLGTLHQEGFVDRVQDEWRLTKSGSDFLSTLPVEAADAILTGRVVIRESIETLIGKRLSDDQHERIWSTLLDVLSALFYQNGLEVIHAIEALINGTPIPDQGQSLREMLKDGARRVATAAAAFPDDRILIETAILDVFAERKGPAFDWLGATCQRFVALCCLGVESGSATAIQEVLTEGGIVPDTDILLTFLCPHANDYHAMRDLLLRWLHIKGKILLAPAVLDEIAYHAWISSVDFQETRHLIGKLHGADRYRYLRNAFVREFHALKIPDHQWDIFISQFRGNSPEDYSKVRKLLHEQLYAEILPDRFDPKLANSITDYLLKLKSTDEESSIEYLVDEDSQYKFKRDGRLLASVAAYLKTDTSLSSTQSCTILSSSSGVRRAAAKFQAEFPEHARIVLTRGAFAYLLSMIPEARLGVDSLRRALFDYGHSGRLNGTEQRALRIIKSSGIYDMPWAGRDLLSTQLKKSMQDEASRLGISPRQLRDVMATGKQPETAARVVVEALTQLAHDPEQAKELRAAQRKIVDLESELGTMRELLRKSKHQPTN